MEMKSKEDARKILEQALDWEVRAEENCDKLLAILRTNGYHDIIEYIKNDEHRHQEMVKQLLHFLKSN